jgi:hypothetical protein
MDLLLCCCAGAVAGGAVGAHHDRRRERELMRRGYVRDPNGMYVRRVYVVRGNNTVTGVPVNNGYTTAYQYPQSAAGPYNPHAYKV